MITKLLHTRYRVNDLDKTVKFYTEVLGLQEISRKTSGRGSTLVFLKTPGSEELIEICHFPASGEVKVQPDLTHLAFGVEDWDKFEAHLKALGVPITDGPHRRPDGTVMAFVDAPEGYEIELIQKTKAGQGIPPPDPRLL